MISLQKLFGKDDKFFGLLEASAEAARNSVRSLTRILSAPAETAGIAKFHEEKERDKSITEQINLELVRTFVTQLEREDIEVLSAALYRIPKTVEKFAERFVISQHLVQDIDFSKHVALLDAATVEIVAMVKLLRNLGGGELDRAKELNRRLQQIEGDADKLILDLLGDLYSGRHDGTKVLALKDLFELLEKVVDRCRDTGNVVTNIVLKNS
ncbi:MAG: DUF47 family protein [Chthoniobacteraceae bacterium]